MKKRILSMLLVLTMLVGMIPGFAINTAAATNAVKVEHNGEVTYYTDLQKAFDGFAPANNKYDGTYVVTLLADTTGVNKTLTYPTNGVIHVTLDLNGYTVSAYDDTKTVIYISLKQGANADTPNTFTIKDSSGNNSGKITGGKGGVNVNGKYCTFNLEGGTITGNHGASKGGGVLVGATTYFKMTGGIITGNSVTGSSSANSGYGGGVLANYGEITGGMIYGNTAYKGTHAQTGRGGGLATEITRTSGFNTLTIANGVIYGNTAENAGDDVMVQTNGLSGTKHSLTIGTENWYIDGWNGTKAAAGNGETARYDAENPVPYTDGGFSNVNNKTIGLKYVAPAATEDPAPEAPSISNSRESGFRFSCGHCSKTVGASNFNVTYTTAGEVYKVEGEYFCDVTWELKAYWEESFKNTFANFYGEHEIISELPETKTFVVKWYAEEEVWKYVGETVTYNVTCEVIPEAPTFLTTEAGEMVMYLCPNDVYHALCATWYSDSITVGDVYTVEVNGVKEYRSDITWDVNKHWDFFKDFLNGNLGIEHELDPATPETVTITMTWDADEELWECKEVAVINIICEIPAPETPDKYGHNVTTSLVKIICDSDSNHEPMIIKWMHQSTKVRDWVSGAVWSDEYDTWVVPIRIDSVATYYVWLNFDEAYDDITHEMIDEDQKCIDTYLKWDADKELWVTLDGKPIEVHVTCQTAPVAPSISWLGHKSFQVQVKGDVDCDGVYGESSVTNGGVSELFATTIPADYYTIGEVYGSRTEGFFVDVTFSITDGDIFFTNWIEKCAPQGGYSYDWTRTPTEVTFTLKYTGDLTGTLDGDRNGDWVHAVTGEIFGKVAEAYVMPTQPSAPTQDTVTDELVAIICDTDGDRHETAYGKWYPQHCSTTSEIVWNDEASAWTVDVRIGSLYIMYVDKLEDANGGTIHELVDDITTVYATLVWNATEGKWVPMEAIELHVTCRTTPIAPSHNQLKNYQISVFGIVDGKEEKWTFNSIEGTYTVGEVYGSREEGFYVDVTITLSEDDAYEQAWIAQKAPGATVADYVYNWAKTPVTVTYTLEYNGSLTGTLHGDRHSNTAYDWVYPATGKTWAVVGEAYLIGEKPDAPVQSNVTEQLVTVICDTDGDRHESVSGKWYPQHCSTTSEITWNDELNAWTVDVKIGSLYIMYVDKLEDANGGVFHDIVGDYTTVYTTLYWNTAEELWIPVEEIEIHTTCKTAPESPEHDNLGSFQIKVIGNVDGKEATYVVTIPEGAYTKSEVYGSREEGFYIDFTVALEDGDTFISTWIEKKAPGANYVYNWDKTEATVNFTLKYAKDLNGNLYGNRDGDWVYTETGKAYGPVAEAYVMPAKPASPKQDTVTDKLVAIICDTDGDRHETVYGKWYPLGHCETTSEITWNEELGAWTVDVKIGSLYIMYVDQLEDANNGTTHELVDDVTCVYTTLVWDPTDNIWYPVEDVELHVTCRTAPIAPAYKQLQSYQIKVWGDVNGSEANIVTSIPEGAYTMSEVYGSREEGFYIDITVELTDGDIFQTNWIEKKNPGYFYNYDFDKTPATITYTLRYNGSLTGTLYGDRHASNTNYDWVLDTTGKTFGVVAEAYLEQVKETVRIVIYRNGDTTTPYTTVSLGKVAKGEVLTLSDYAIADYYANESGFEFYGWYNDGAWNQYKAGNNPAATESITVNGYTNIICMVYDYEEVVVKSVVDGNSEVIFTGTALYGTNLVEWLDANVTVADITGYSYDKWYNAESGEKIAADVTVTDAVEVYVAYTRNTFTITFNTNGGSAVAPITQTHGYAVSAPANPTKTGYTFAGWVRDDGSAFSFDGYVMEMADFTLTATWTANKYGVLLIPNYGKINSGNITEYTYGIGAKLTTNITRPGYVFVGWYDNASFKGEPIAEITATDMGDKVFYAKWEIDMDKIPTIRAYDVYVSHSVKGGSVSVDKTFVPADVTVTITVEPELGYIFSGLTVTTVRGKDVKVRKVNDTTYKFTMPASDVVVDAAFEYVVVDTTCKGDKNCPMYSFKDLDTDMWYHDGIHYCLENGLMNGYGNNIFAPEAETTRAMIVTILWRLEGSPKVDYKMTFEDVKDGEWYIEAIRWAASKGIVLGYDDETFGPDDTITREQLATILYRYEKMNGGGFSGLWMFKLDYVDTENVSDWAYEAMCWMTMNKIVQGKNDNVLDPQGGATRAEAATMLYRYCTKDEK